MSSVDIIIPNYNYGKYLGDAVRSIQDQGIPDLRILIMDNASTDNSVEIANELAGKDSRIEVLARKKNIGIVASLNEGNEWASSKYLVNLSADDLFPPGALSRAVEVLERNKSTVAAFGQCLFFNDGETPSIPSRFVDGWTVESGDAFIERFLTSHAVTLSPLVRTSVQKQCGDYRKDTESIDAEMWLRWACHGSIASTRVPQAVQRLHGLNISATGWRDPAHRFQQAVALRECFFAHEGGLLPNAAKLRRKAYEAVGKDAYWSAWSHLARGKIRDAVKIFRIAFKLHPTAVILPPVDQLGKYQDLTPRIKKAVPGAEYLGSRPTR
jgi:glycosyltransferase involved in cell wall biosynthesis